MASYSIAPEACKAPRDLGYLPTPDEGGVRRHGESECLTQIGNRYPNRPDFHLRTRMDSKRWWRVNPSQAQQLADDAEVSLESLLCSGCRKLLARLQRSGDWP